MYCLILIYLKKISKECIDIHKNNFSTKIKHQYILGVFEHQLSIGKQNRNIEFGLVDFQIHVKDIEMGNNKLQLDDEVFSCTQFILEKFMAKTLPVELYTVLLANVYLTYEANKEIFQNQSKELNQKLVYYVVTEQVESIGKKIIINDGYISIQINPPRKNNLTMVLHMNTICTTCALEQLVAYFGHEIWHKQFTGYDKNESSEYFMYNNPDYQMEKITRTYKNEYLETNMCHFLSDEYRNIFFKTWENRLTNQELKFFYEYIKPKLLDKKMNIIFSLKDYEHDSLKKYIRAVMDTSQFKCKYDNVCEDDTVIVLKEETEDMIILTINKKLYK